MNQQLMALVRSKVAADPWYRPGMSDHDVMRHVGDAAITRWMLEDLWLQARAPSLLHAPGYTIYRFRREDESTLQDRAVAIQVQGSDGKRMTLFQDGRSEGFGPGGRGVDHVCGTLRKAGQMTRDAVAAGIITEEQAQHLYRGDPEQQVVHYYAF